MGPARYLTLLWPGMPWLWLRGSLAGLILALAFAVVLDAAVLSSWIWSEVVDLQVSLGLWTATAAVWILATVSALSAFPPALPVAHEEAMAALFVKARDAYLARDWLLAETRLCALLELSPLDGEAQLLLASLLRRVGRLRESRAALEKLARSDSGTPWRSAIARDLQMIANASPTETAAEAATILTIDSSAKVSKNAAAGEVAA